MANSNLIDPKLLRQLVPPCALNAENFNELASKAEVETIPARKVLFKKGDNDGKTWYLLEGKVTLSPGHGKDLTVVGGSERAKHPLVNLQPRQHTAKTETECKVIRVESELLDIMVTWDQASGIEVNELQKDKDQEASEVDWMTKILQSKAFLQVPPANIHTMFMRMEEVRVKSGDVILKQGEEGDYYYIIKSGKARVARSSKMRAQVTLAELSTGDGFGEEALLSGAQRNAAVVMLTDGYLMRLSKADFDELLIEPMLRWVSPEQAVEKVKAGAIWLDTRLEAEHKNQSIKGSLNIPLFMLRLKADTLDANKEYLAYCDTGRRSSAAAFLLYERGFQVYVLKGGLGALSKGSS